MAKASQSLIESGDKEMNGTYNGYTAPQLLYVMSCYLNGNGIEEPGDFEPPENPQKYSIFLCCLKIIIDKSKVSSYNAIT